MDRAWKRPYLGFAFHFGDRIKLRIYRESPRRVKATLRQYTRRNRSIAMAKRIAQLNRYLVGWSAGAPQRQPWAAHSGRN